MSMVNGFLSSYKKSSSLHLEHGSSSGTSTPFAIISREPFLRIFNARVLRHEIFWGFG
ncbi:1835_t:CDS:1, partial [Gigaspora rosea]